METRIVLITTALLFLSSGIAFLYLIFNKPLFPETKEQEEDNERANNLFINIMVATLIGLLIIAGIMIYQYLKIIL